MTGPVVTTPSPASSSKRPTAVTVVTILALLAGGYLVIDGALNLRDTDRNDTSAILYGVLQVGLGVVALAIAFGALLVKPWAWKLFMTVAVVGLTVQILRYFAFGDPDFARMAIYAVIVFALTPRDVQVAFHIRPPPNVDLSRTTRNPSDRD
jgi:hypothetical protein